MNLREVRRNQKGITLLALVVTIIIIIILSTVTINTVFGESGLVTQAKRAKDLTGNATYAEGESMNKLLQEYANIMAEDGGEEIAPPDTNVEEPEPVVNEIEPEPPVEDGEDASDISKAPASYYGAEVTNYTAPHAGVDKWRIFYADGTNIYLIADDYIAGANTPKGQGGSSIYENSTYKLSFNNVTNDYTGASWISNNSKGAKWLSQFLSSYGTSTYGNIKAVAYMMDTNVWSGYYASEYAEYAMGGPTIEMFCESYKDTHPSKYLECGNVDTEGYQIRWNGGSWSNWIEGLVQDDFNSIYIKSDESKTNGMWLASPATGITSELICTHYDGSLGAEVYGQPFFGLRPIVCLKSETRLEKLEDGTFKIVKSKEPITADDISKAPVSYYGTEVINYEAPHAGVEKWRIFYADDTNVYLIADDYIAGGNAPDGQGESVIYENTTYQLRFNNSIDDYEGANWISQNSKGSKWLSQYLSKNGSSTNNNIKAVAYMMDTNVWSEYYASEDAEYAMGGPTIEMFCASYKDTHRKYLECGNLNLYGYQLRWNEDSWNEGQDDLFQDDFNSIYIKSDESKAEGMWLASPAARDGSKVMEASYYGAVTFTGCFEPYSINGFRPIVCLKPEIQFEKQTGGTVMIVK